MKKKIIISFLSIFIIALSIFGFKYIPILKIKNTATIIFTGIIAGDGGLLWDMSTDEFKSNVIEEYGSEQEFHEVIRNAAKDYVQLKEWKIVNVLDFGDSATVIVTMQYDKAYKRNAYYLYLSKTNKGWQLKNARIKPGK